MLLRLRRCLLALCAVKRPQKQNRTASVAALVLGIAGKPATSVHEGRWLKPYCRAACKVRRGCKTLIADVG